MAASVHIPRPRSRTPAISRRIVFLLALAAALVVPLWHLHVINRGFPSNHSDLADEWAGARAALRGEDPYSAAGMRDTQIAYYGRALIGAEDKDPQGFPYPAHMVILMAPLAVLPWTAARLVFLAVAFPLLVLGLWLSIRFLRLPFTPGSSALAVFLALVSWPVVWGLRLQQPTLLVAAIVLIACYLLSRDRELGAGVLLAVATVKPQLVLPLLLWLFLWACLQRRWTLIVSFCVTCAGLLVAAQCILPGWFGHWIAELRGYGLNHGELPLQSLLGPQLGLAVTGMLIVCAAWGLWRLRHCSTESPEFGLAVSLALSAAVCLTLTMLATIYNQVAVIPACFLIVAARPKGSVPAFLRGITLLLVAWGYTAVLCAAVGETLFGRSNFFFGISFLNPLLPVAATAALAFAAVRHRAEATAMNRLSPQSMQARTSGEPSSSAHTYDDLFYRYIQTGSTRSAEKILPLLAAQLPLESVLDVGCGAGAWLAVYRRLGIPGCHGVDGDYVKPSSLLIPPETFTPRDVAQPFDLGRRFSLAQCLEVGEHIPPASSATLVANLVLHSDRVLFSAAIPGQGGENHVNERPYQFWRALFAAHGYAPYDYLRPLLRGASDVEIWYRQNTILYVANRSSAQLPPAVAQTRIPDDQPIANLASVPYRLRTGILARLPVSWLTCLSVLKHRCILLFHSVTESTGV